MGQTLLDLGKQAFLLETGLWTVMTLKDRGENGSDWLTLSLSAWFWEVQYVLKRCSFGNTASILFFLLFLGSSLRDRFVLLISPS